MFFGIRSCRVQSRKAQNWARMTLLGMVMQIWGAG